MIQAGGAGPGITIPPALVGQIAVFAIFALVAFALLKEAARVVIKVLLVVGVVVGVAVWAGWLDETVAGNLFTAIGDLLTKGIRWVTEWLVGVWGGVKGSGGG